ncbi:DUF1566 domain-containing protein [Paraburkholderia caballeronis]|uniref:DUF1566 domain-containing protein n=1 Tax=Paraburkholderia caballeronis TaxID=416943 RepID=UPI001066A205|nr:DUF1566 domain-containing protein [Paraburkholderia caballeronis]TDV04646.1 hypothetical protein C7408_1318 [Paraburkholderia caballeronis]TDV07889.1 hypothetical protein C7406_1338 [Paraburkholderia caballeronis]TDV18180.1 hypothetical protein C7404_1318 [Paraburkholderia caballeronis]
MGEIIIPFHGGKLVVPHEAAARAWLDKVLAASDASATTTAIAVPRIGEYWDGQGGIYAGVMPLEDGGIAHRIVSIDEAKDFEYGGYDHTVAGADSKLDGLANTQALLSDSKEHPAARWCTDYAKDGHSDFYLPAQRELSLAWATIATVFGPYWYWSSTQFSAYNAWGQYFDGGYQDNAIKYSKGRVRAFRRLNFSL